MADIIDILVVETGEGGDFLLTDGDLTPAHSIENILDYYLLGGNIEQNTEQGNEENIQNFDWWGNSFEKEEVYNSNFERTLRSVVLSSSGRQDLINAAKKDLEELSEQYDISVDGIIPAPGKFQLQIKINGFSNKAIKKVYLFNNSELINSKVNVEYSKP